VSRTKKTVIVDVIFVSSVMWAEGWERGERGERCENQRVGQVLPDWDQGGWEFVTTSKKLALQVNGGSFLFLQGL
jgi:hypothetical protein